jgi:hypothetical protein
MFAFFGGALQDAFFTAGQTVDAVVMDLGENPINLVLLLRLPLESALETIAGAAVPQPCHWRAASVAGAVSGARVMLP